MPVRAGFSRYRKEIMEQELDTIIAALPMLGVEKVILTGAMVSDDYAPDSRIELIVVHKTDRPFGRRSDFLLIPPGRLGSRRYPGIYPGRV